MGLGLAAVKAEIDTCSGHKVDYSLTGSAVVTEDNLSALSTFQQHISPSFTMAVINRRRGFAPCHVSVYRRHRE